MITTFMSNLEEAEGAINLNNSSELEEIFRALISDGSLVISKSDDEVPLDEIKFALKRSGYKLPDELSTDQIYTIGEAYHAARKKAFPGGALSDILGKKPEINSANYNNIVLIINEGIKIGNIKTNSQGGDIPFSNIFDALKRAGYEEINEIQAPEDVKDLIRRAYHEACKKTSVVMTEALQQKKKINYTNYGDIVGIIKKGIENTSIKVDSQDSTFIPFTDIYNTLEKAGYEEINRFQTPEDVKDLIIEAWEAANKHN